VPRYRSPGFSGPTIESFISSPGAGDAAIAAALSATADRGSGRCCGVVVGKPPYGRQSSRHGLHDAQLLRQCGQRTWKSVLIADHGRTKAS